MDLKTKIDKSRFFHLIKNKHNTTRLRNWTTCLIGPQKKSHDNTDKIVERLRRQLIRQFW